MTTHLTNAEYYIRPSKYQLCLTVCDCVYRSTFFCATLLDYGLDLSDALIRVGLTSEFLLWQWSNLAAGPPITVFVAAEDVDTVFITVITLLLKILVSSVLASHTLQRYCNVISHNCNVFFWYK